MSDNIKNMVSAIASNNNAEAQKYFESEVKGRIVTSIEGRKGEVARSMFDQMDSTDTNDE